MSHTFSKTNSSYFDELAQDLEDDVSDGSSSDIDTEDEDEQAPDLYQDESDSEIMLQPATQGTQSQQQQNERKCIICMDRLPEVVLVPCGHMNLCAPCAHQWHEENDNCPTCRKAIQMIVPFIPH